MKNYQYKRLTIFLITILFFVNHGQAQNHQDNKENNQTIQKHQRRMNFSYSINAGNVFRLRNTWYGNVFAGGGTALIGKEQVLTMSSSVVNRYDGNKGQQAYILGLGSGY